jgi:DNA-directed RNA polymerase alpha subunit
MQEKADELLDATPELPDDTPLDRVRLTTRIQTFLRIHGLKTVGDVLVASDERLISFPKLGPRSVDHLRKTLGSPSRDSIVPAGKMAAEKW